MSDEDNGAERPRGFNAPSFRLALDGGLILAVVFTAGGWASSARTMQREIDALKASPVNEARMVRVEEQMSALRDEFRAYRAEAREDAQAVIRKLDDLQPRRITGRLTDPHNTP